MSGQAELTHLFRALKAPAAARAFPALAQRAREESWSYEKFVEALLGTEVSARDSHGGENRIKTARFPARKTLEEFDFTFQRSVKKQVIEHLGQLDFLHGRQNVIMLGPPGLVSHCTSCSHSLISQSSRAAGTSILRPFRCPSVTWMASQFSALDLVQHGLAGAAKQSGCVCELHEPVGDVGDEPCADVVVEPDSPGRVGCGLLAWEQSVAQPSPDREARNTELDGGLLDGDEVRCLGPVVARQGSRRVDGLP